MHNAPRTNRVHPQPSSPARLVLNTLLALAGLSAAFLITIELIPARRTPTTLATATVPTSKPATAITPSTDRIPTTTPSKPTAAPEKLPEPASTPMAPSADSLPNPNTTPLTQDLPGAQSPVSGPATSTQDRIRRLRKLP